MPSSSLQELIEVMLIFVYRIILSLKNDTLLPIIYILICNCGYCDNCFSERGKGWNFHSLVGICPLGHYCPEATSVPIECQPGEYNNRTGSENIKDCLACIPGWYCPGTYLFGNIPAASWPIPCSAQFLNLFLLRCRFQLDTGRSKSWSLQVLNLHPWIAMILFYTNTYWQ